MATKERKAQLLKEHTAKIAEVNSVCAKGTNAEVEGKLTELANIEKEYRAIYEKEVFASLPSVRDALEMHHFETISHKKLTDEGVMTGVEASVKNVQIDLKRYCESHNLDTAWYYELQALNKRLTLKVAMSIGVPANKIREINDCYAMDKLAEQIELGKTPDSNTQCIKHMQKVLDMLEPECGKINNYDLAYVMAGYTKRSNKESLKVVCSKHSILQSLLTDVFHNVLTHKGYGLDFKRKNATEQVEQIAEKTAKGGKSTTAKGGKSTTKNSTSKKSTEVQPAVEAEPVVAA